MVNSDSTRYVNSMWELSDFLIPFSMIQKHGSLLFLRNQPCPWARLTFDTLPEDLQRLFLETELPVAYIKSVDTDEVRDLFVRLQAGLPLTHQEKRDAHPGDFNHFVLKLGGKTGLVQYPGQPFFSTGVGPKPSQGRSSNAGCPNRDAVPHSPRKGSRRLHQHICGRSR